MTKYIYKKGYSLVESLIYIAVFIIISSVIVSLIILILDLNRQALLISSLNRDAVSSLETITREIRSAKSVDISNSVFSTSSGSLQLNTIDNANQSQLVKFYLNFGIIKMNKDSIYFGPLSSSNVVVNSLIFNLSTSTEQSLIKIQLSLRATSGKYTKEETFYSSVRLRTDN